MSGSQNGKIGDGPGDECLRLAPSLAAFLEDALPPEEARAIATHVAGCDWCAWRLAAYGEVDALVRQAPALTPPPSLRAGLYARIAAERAAQASGYAGTSELETIMRETDIQNTAVAPSPSRIPPRRGAISHRIARWTSAVAALVVVALLAGLFVSQQHGRRTGPAAHPTATAQLERACAPSDIQASLPANSMLSDLAMTGPAAGWAVGAVADSATAPTTDHALIMRYSNCEWKPVSMNIANAKLAGVAMISANEGWAVGEQTQGNTKAPLLMHYKNGTWSRVTFSNAGTIYTFTMVRALSTGEVWIVGRTPPGKKANPGISLLHFSSGQWSRIDTPFNEVSDIAPAGPDSVWLIGENYANYSTHVSELAHYQSGALVKDVSLPQSTYLTSLRMLAPDDGWATGYAYVSGNETATNPTVNHPIALHYDGSSWSQVNIGASPSAYSYYVLSQGDAWSYSISTSVPQHIVSTQREQAGQWQNVPWPFKDIVSFGQPVCATTDACWTIGTSLLPGKRVPNGSGGSTVVYAQAPVLLLYASGSWHEYGLSK